MSLEAPHGRANEHLTQSSRSTEPDSNRIGQKESKEEDLEALKDQLFTWLRMPDWVTSYLYLHTHPFLLTNTAEQILKGLRPIQEDEQAQVMIDQHQTLLQQARLEGIEAAYEHFLIPKLEASRNNQEVATYADLQDPATWDSAGIAAFQQYLSSGQITDLNWAGECWLAALKLTPTDSPGRVARANNLGNGLRYLYARTGNLFDLEVAITAYEQALQAMPPDAPDRVVLLYNLSTGLRDRYAHTGDLADLEALITAYEQALQTTPLDAPDRAALLNNLGGGLRDRYARTGNLADLEVAITDFQQALQATPPDAPDRATLLHNLSLGLNDRYAHTGDLADLEALITAFQQALQATPPDAPNRAALLGNLGIRLSDRYTRTGNLSDLEAAITAYEQALQAMPSDAPNRVVPLHHLGNGLRDRYACTGNLSDLEAAITAYEQALQATPPDAPDRDALLHNLSLGLNDRYAHTGDLADLEALITAYEQALQATPPDAPDRATLLHNLSLGLNDRYTRTGNLSDLEALITAYEQALQAMPSDAPDRAEMLNNRGVGLIDRYTRTGNLADLEAAITAFQQALQARPPDAPNRVVPLHHLGNGLRDRYTRTGNLADLEAAITAFQQALQATPPDAPDRDALLHNLGVGLSYRYTRTGDLTDLEAAITAYEQALQTTPDAPNRAALLSNLGGGLIERYARTGDLADLEALITAHEQALQTTPPDAPNRAEMLNNRGTGLRYRYTRTGDLTDLDAAITDFQQALQTTPPDALNRALFLNSLGTGLRYRYTRTGDLTDLEAAIATYEQALQITPPDAPNRAEMLNNRGVGLSYRYTRTGDLTDLEAAITAYEQALQTTPPDAPNRAALLGNLGVGLRDRYARTGDLADLEAAITAWETRWLARSLHFTSLPVVYKLGQQHQEENISSNLIAAYLECAIQHAPSDHASLRSALVVAEGNKSRLLTQMIGRGPLPLPPELPPQIAEREQYLLAELTTLDTLELAMHDNLPTIQESNSHLNSLQQRQGYLRELKDLWESIACLGSEGMEYVALRRGDIQTWQDLTQLAMQVGTNTALLSFFSTSDRALLFLLSNGWFSPHIVAIPLNKTGWLNILERFFREIHCYRPGQRRGETWDQSLRALFLQAQDHLEGVERLILAPAGFGHLLPWAVLAERAGWRNSVGQPLPLITLPSLGILPRLRQKPPVPQGPALVIGNPLGDLPFSEKEANEVAGRFGTQALLGATATKYAVLTRLPEAGLIHLATHAFFDANNPLDSGILLADGVLTAREILQHRLQADLLVLSACESGQVGSLGGEELAGLSQAFLQAGVRSLLVSLWRVNDPATATFMRAFYNARQAGADKAQALRQAMTHMQQHPQWTHPYYWGAFILIGDWDWKMNIRKDNDHVVNDPAND